MYYEKKYMSNYAWASDIHLDHIDTNDQLIKFGESLTKSRPDGVFLSGDISIAPRLVYHLSALERITQCPIYFVLGNHDYYSGDISDVRSKMKQITNSSQYLRYLPTHSYVSLTPKTALVGHDGWYDGLYGDVKNSNAMMNDWVMIKDFIDQSGGYLYVKENGKIKDTASLLQNCQRLAHESMLHVHSGIKAATRHYKNIIIMTHVPPFTVSNGNRSNGIDVRPWYGSKIMGDMLLQASQSYPQHKFTVLCGHSHTKQNLQITSNLEVKVGGSTYGSPSLSEIVSTQ